MGGGVIGTRTVGRRRRAGQWLALGLGLLLVFAGFRPVLAQDRLTSENLAGRLLVAAPHMTDPNFRTF